jgi:hypothetical protein
MLMNRNAIKNSQINFSHSERARLLFNLTCYFRPLTCYHNIRTAPSTLVLIPSFPFFFLVPFFLCRRNREMIRFVVKIYRRAFMSSPSSRYLYLIHSHSTLHDFSFPFSLLAMPSIPPDQFICLRSHGNSSVDRKAFRFPIQIFT